jgi:E3 ubiquitin-protein ligase RNF13
MDFLFLFRECFFKRSISKTDLEKLPCYDYVAKENGSNPLDCAICLENFTIGDKCRLLPICKHIFHAQCVDKWLLKTPICPICRSRVCSHSANKVVIRNNGREMELSRNVSLELRGNNPA